MLFYRRLSNIVKPFSNVKMEYAVTKIKKNLETPTISIYNLLHFVIEFHLVGNASIK